MCIEFRRFLQSSLLRESTKKGHLNFWVSLWKRKCKDFEIRRSLFDIFFLTSNTERNRPKLMTALVTDQLLNTGVRKVQLWIHYFLTIMGLIFYVSMKAVRLKITLMIQITIPVPLTSPLSTPNSRLSRQNFLTGLIITIWEPIRENVTY